MTFFYMGDHNFISLPPRVLHDMPRLSEILFLGGEHHGRTLPPSQVDEISPDHALHNISYTTSRLVTIFGTDITTALHSSISTRQHVVACLQKTRFAAAFGVDGITKL